MGVADDREGLDVPRLTGALRVLASPTRVRLLWALRVPKRAGEMRIPAEEDRGGLQSERLLSRTTLLEHLQVLEEAGLVERRAEDHTYVVSQQGLFSVVQDLGRLARIRPVVEVDVDVTRPTPPAPAGPMPQGPRLVVVGGPREGLAFALQGGGPWTLGRAADADLRLDYDPHVSRLHAVVHRAAKGFEVEAPTGATNPARLDFADLRAGTRTPFPAGAILAVGASRLVLQAG